MLWPSLEGRPETSVVRCASLRTAACGAHYEGLWRSGRQPQFRSTTIASGAFPDAELLPSARTSPSVRLGHGLRPTTSRSGLLNQPDKHESPSVYLTEP